MKSIPLAQGKFAFVDDEDFELVSQYKWCVKKKGDRYYAVSGDKPQICMHHLVLGISGSNARDTDHEDHNGLNNCKGNLRICTRSQNNANARKRKGVVSSKYKGASWYKRDKCWQAFMCRTFLGRFKDELDAAAAYDIAALEFFGEFALTNFEMAGGVGLS